METRQDGGEEETCLNLPPNACQVVRWAATGKKTKQGTKQKLGLGIQNPGSAAVI